MADMGIVRATGRREERMSTASGSTITTCSKLPAEIVRHRQRSRRGGDGLVGNHFGTPSGQQHFYFRQPRQRRLASLVAPTSRKANGSTIVSLTHTRVVSGNHTRVDWQARLVAVDDKGQEHMSSDGGTGATPDNIFQLLATFPKFRARVSRSSVSRPARTIGSSSATSRSSRVRHSLTYGTDYECAATPLPRVAG